MNQLSDSLKLNFLASADVPLLAPIMERAFDEDARIHTGMPQAGPHNGDAAGFLNRWCFHERVTAYTIWYEGVLSGAVNLFIDVESGISTLGMVFVDPAIKGQGIGAKVWAMVEALYPHTRKWRTETIWYSTYNHYFYVTKCGFHITAIDPLKNNPVAQYRFEKIMKRA